MIVRTVAHKRDSLGAARRIRRPFRLALVALVALLMPSIAQAQGGTVGGVVVDATSRAPIADVLVAVEGTTLRATTNPNGRFRITGVTGDQVTLSFRRLGFSPLTQQVRVGAASETFALTTAATQLNEVIVTGTAEAVEKRALGNSVSSIKAIEAVQLAPPPDVSNLLNAKAPGVVVLQGSGAVGSGARVKIRGPASIALSDAPLLYIDGVRVNNNQGTGIAVQAFGSGIVSRLNDLDPENIESIEIIKGPAAATLYGTEANNGVIQIITKRGREGRPTFTATIKQGANWFMDAADRIGTLYARDPATRQIVTWNAVEAEKARGTPIYTTGYVSHYNLGVNGGTQAVRYNISSSLDKDEGVEPTNKLWRWSGNVNVGVTPRSTVDINSTFGLTLSEVDLPLEGGSGVGPNMVFGTPLTVNTPRRGFSGAPPEAIWEVIQAQQKVNRVLGSLQINHRPLEWLSQRLTVGLDLAGEDNIQLNRVPSQHARQFFNTPFDLGGQKFVFRNDLATTTADYGATVRAALTSAFRSSTSVGVQYFRRRTYQLRAQGQGFPAAGLETVNATTTNFGAGEDLITNVTLGVFAQEQIDYQNRIFLTGALRADDNSAFGSNFDYVVYPKVSASWVISEEKFFTGVPYVSSLKLRAAYGETGQQPDAFAAIRAHSPVTAGNGQAAVTPTAFGNPDLEPERGKEIELGFDAELFTDRLGVEFTYYSQKTSGALFPRDVLPSLGFPGTRLENTAEIENKGIEMQLRGTAIKRPNLQWDLTWNHAENRNKVLSLGGPEFVDVVQVFGAPRADHRHTVGYPMGSNWVRAIVSARLDANGRAVDQMCADGKGGTTPCYDAAGNPIAPRVYYGRTTPPIEGSMSSSLTLWNRLRLYGLVDYKLNHRITQNNARARCQIFYTCLRNAEPQNYDPAVVAEDQSSGGAGFRSVFIEDASFFKLRDVSARVTLPENWARQVGAGAASLALSARNLHTWTKYTGTDPESFFVSEQFVRVDQAQTPQLTQFLATINFTF